MNMFDLTLPTPLNETAIQFLLFLTFELHLIFVLLMLGTAILSMYYFVSTWWGTNERVSEMRWDKSILRKFLPLKALAVILGVGPLLLFQAYYSIPFLTATSLHAFYWMSVIAFLIIALLAFDALGQKMDVHPIYHLVIGLIALILLFAIPGVFVAVVVTIENPDYWIRMAENGGSFSGIIGIHWLLRYLHILGAAIILGAGFHYIFSSVDVVQKRRLLYWIVGGTFFQLIGGFTLYLSIPRQISSPVLLILIIAISFILLLLWIIFTKLIKGNHVHGFTMAGFLLVIITSMLLARQHLQNETLIPLNRQLVLNAENYLKKTDPYVPASLKSYAAHISQPISSGSGIYMKSCSFCHGKDGLGDGVSAAKLEVPPEKLAKLRIDEHYLFAILSKGIAGSGMPNYRFYTRPQLESLISYMDSKFGICSVPRSEHTHVNRETLLEWQRTCSVCHGMDGRGSTLGKQFKPATPDFTKYGLLPDYALQVITDGYPRTMMPGFPNINIEIRSEFINIIDNIRASSDNR